MNDSQKKFFALLDQYPRLNDFWDREDMSLDTEQLDAQMGVLSGGEKVVARILASIWLGNAGDAYRIDLTDVAALSSDCRRPIVEWIANPFWP